VDLLKKQEIRYVTTIILNVFHEMFL